MLDVFAVLVGEIHDIDDFLQKSTDPEVGPISLFTVLAGDVCILLSHITIQTDVASFGNARIANHQSLIRTLTTDSSIKINVQTQRTIGLADAVTQTVAGAALLACAV